MTQTALSMEAGTEWTALGCLARVVVTEPHALPAARQLLAGRLAKLDSAASRFRADSELVRLPADGASTPVSPLLADLLATALRAAEATDGDLDPTLGDAICALGYDRDFTAVPAEGPAVRVVTRPAQRWRQIRLSPEGVRLPPGIRLDLGATAKAYAADRAAHEIANRLHVGALVALGGDVAMAGPPPAGGWRIRVEDRTQALGDQVGPDRCVVLQGGGLATSSVTARRWSRGGQLLHHLLDPRTGLPANSPWRTVSVAAASCLDANIASTTAIVRGERGRGWLESLGLPARLVATDGSLTLVGGWPEGTP